MKRQMAGHCDGGSYHGHCYWLPWIQRFVAVLKGVSVWKVVFLYQKQLT